MDDRVWDVTVFTKNRDRLLRGEIAEAFFQAVLEEAREHGLLSDEHFTVDGTLIEAWAGHKSFRPKDEGKGGRGGGRKATERDFHGERRKNDTHASTTDPESRLFRKGKGKEAKLCFMGHVVTENRHGLCSCANHAGDGYLRASSFGGDDEEATARPSIDAGRRQGLRHPGPASRSSKAGVTPTSPRPLGTEQRRRDRHECRRLGHPPGEAATITAVFGCRRAEPL